MIAFRFYLVTDRRRCAPRSLLSVVRAACDAGVRAIQLREKDLGDDELEEYVKRLSEITRETGAKLLVNRPGGLDQTTDVFLAASLGGDGFHFPETAPFPHALRSRFPELLVGVSTHARDRAVAAATEGADFVTFGPVFDTPSKRAFGAPQGLDALGDVCAACGIPVFAIGGVTPDNAAQCIDAGAHGVAAIGAVMEAPDVAAAVRRFEDALGGL